MIRPAAAVAAVLAAALLAFASVEPATADIPSGPFVPDVARPGGLVTIATTTCEGEVEVLLLGAATEAALAELRSTISPDDPRLIVAEVRATTPVVFVVPKLPPGVYSGFFSCRGTVHAVTGTEDGTGWFFTVPGTPDTSTATAADRTLDLRAWLIAAAAAAAVLAFLRPATGPSRA